MLLFFAPLLAFSIGGCHGTGNAPMTKAPSHAYPLRGVVVSVDQGDGKLTLKHEAVPGLMSAMTMEYRVVDPSALTELHPGDLISAQLLADHDATGPINMRIKDIDILAQARPDYKPTSTYHLPAKGDAVPDFKLLDQSDHTISLKEFRGKIVLMTFIYTRCPLSDYCPRMSHNFADIDKALQKDPKLYDETHLLSVSFDPAYDTPKVLRSYGEAYTGRYVKETFRHWQFAAPPVAELTKVEHYFDVGVTPGENGTLQHSLSTVIIGKDGKVVAFFPTNDWTPAEVMSQIQHAASVKS
ncbi:MAG: redoxin domain-containing protein [Acidobacteria bacterium]|nr:redoxin domain-containing protein [Acidobacteriota bacterium]